MVADHQSGRDQSGITEHADAPALRGALRRQEEAAKRHGLFVNCRSSARSRSAAGLLRPAAIVPDVGAIQPRNRLALDTARSSDSSGRSRLRLTSSLSTPSATSLFMEPSL